MEKHGLSRPAMSPELIEIARCLAQISEDLHSLLGIFGAVKIITGPDGVRDYRLLVEDVVTALSRGHEEAD